MPSGGALLITVSRQGGGEGREEDMQENEYIAQAAASEADSPSTRSDIRP